MNQLAGKRNVVHWSDMQQQSTQAIIRKRLLGNFFGMLGRILACYADAILAKHRNNHDDTYCIRFWQSTSTYIIVLWPSIRSPSEENGKP